MMSEWKIPENKDPQFEEGYLIGHKHGYIKGWHDAIITALKETHSVHTEEGNFRVVQEETLIGVGMAYEQVSTEKTGHWIRVHHIDGNKNTTMNKCSNCFQEFGWDIETGISFEDYKFCPNCGAKMEVEE